jgi:hypothetical protein
MFIEICVVDAHTPRGRVLLNEYWVGQPVRVQDFPNEPYHQQLGNFLLDCYLLVW